MKSPTQRSVPLHYFMALLAPALMAGVTKMTWPLLEESPIALFLLAVVFCGWYGGFGPGLLSLAVSIFLTGYFFLNPFSPSSLHYRHDLVKLLVLAIFGVITSLLSARTKNEKRRAEIGLEAVRQAEQKYRDIFDNALEGIFQTSPEGRFLVANPALATMFGFDSPEELIRERADISKQHYVDPKRREEFKRLLESEGTVQEFEYEAFRKDGSRIWVSDNVRAVRNGSGKVLCYEGIAKDITERKRAEDALRESEERYRELFENAKDATYVHDLNGRYVSINRAGEKLSGRSRDEIIGKVFSDFIASEDVETVNQHLDEKLLKHGETVYETRMIANDGGSIPVEISSHLIYENGAPIGVQGIARDISERKRAEERLREYEKVVEGLEEMIVVVDRNFRYLLANRAYLKYRKCTREQVVDCLVPEVVGQALFDDVLKHKLGLAFQGQVVKYEVKIANPNGDERDLLAAYFPIEGAAGVDRVACVIQDITDRKRAEEALRQSEERFSKAFYSSPASLTITQLEDGRLLEVNPAFLRMTGYSREEVIGRSTLEIGLWAHPDYRLAMTKKLRNGGAIDNLEFKFRKKSGELRDGLFSGELIELGAEPCVLGIALDTTERIRAETALQSYSRRLIEAQEKERQNIARELHDQIGQVLTAIRINLQTVRKISRISESRILIDEGMAMLDEALAQVRDLSFELRPSLLDDLGLVAALRWYCERFSRRTGIRASYTMDLPEGTRLNVDLETACFRIAQEALTNVARHAGARNVSISLTSLADEICLSIKDDGKGFDSHAQDVGRITNHLGLRGMKQRALVLDGRLEINSSHSRGTEISAHFPQPGKEELKRWNALKF